MYDIQTVPCQCEVRARDCVGHAARARAAVDVRGLDEGLYVSCPEITQNNASVCLLLFITVLLFLFLFITENDLTRTTLCCCHSLWLEGAAAAAPPLAARLRGGVVRVVHLGRHLAVPLTHLSLHLPT